MGRSTDKKHKRQINRERAAEAVARVQAGIHSGEKIGLPQKKYYRQRAHANPFSDHNLEYPLSPEYMDWASHFPAFVDPDTTHTNLGGYRKLLKDVEVVDIGCGFGGLLVGLAPLLPDTLMVGMEIRAQVTEYLNTRIHALRSQQIYLQNNPPDPNAADTTTNVASEQQAQAQAQEQTQTEQSPTTTTSTSPNPEDTEDTGPTTLIPGGFQNISAIRSNTMKFFPNFFRHQQLSKIFVCFPDPHFKARKHKARIISETLNAEYAYALRPGGLLYTITDVEEYHHWVLRHFGGVGGVEEEGEEKASDGGAGGIRELFERVSDEELARDPCATVMAEETEESKKVTRNKGNKYVAVFRRKADPEWPA